MYKISCVKCNSFIYFWFYVKILLDCTELFSPNKYETHGKIINNYFKDKCDRRKHNSKTSYKEIDETKNKKLFVRWSRKKRFNK